MNLLWLSSVTGVAIAAFLLWSNRTRSLAWPEAALIGLGLVVSAGPLIKSVHCGKDGCIYETRDVQAAALVAKGANDTATKNEERIDDLAAKIAKLNSAVETLKPAVADATAKAKVEDAVKAVATTDPGAAAAKATTQMIQKQIDQVVRDHQKLFKVSP